MAAQKTNELKKVFLHRGGGVNKESTSIGLGNLALLFQSEPSLTEHRVVQEKGEEIRSYFFPFVKLGTDSKKLVARVNALKSNYYKVRIEPVTNPLAGVMVHITYNPDEVGLRYDRFDAINTDKAIVFHFFNKRLMKELKKPLPMTRMVHNTRTPCIVIDPGHGGDDFGTIGCGSMPEKKVTLALGMQIARELKKKDIMSF